MRPVCRYNTRYCTSLFNRLVPFRNNVLFNMPRAGICVNDNFGGGNRIQQNVIFNTVRETHDHGGLNTWFACMHLTRFSTSTTTTATTTTTTTNNNLSISIQQGSTTLSLCGRRWCSAIVSRAIVCRAQFNQQRLRQRLAFGYERVYVFELLLSPPPKYSRCTLLLRSRRWFLVLH